MDAKTEAKFQRDMVEDLAPPLQGPCYYCGKPADNLFKTGQFICDHCINLQLKRNRFCIDCGQYEGGYCHHYKTEVPRTFYSRCNAPKEGNK